MANQRKNEFLFFVVYNFKSDKYFIRILFLLQMRVETPDNNNKTKDFLLKRSSDLVNLVSQKLTDAAKSFMKPVIELSAQNQTVKH